MAGKKVTVSRVYWYQFSERPAASIFRVCCVVRMLLVPIFGETRCLHLQGVLCATYVLNFLAWHAETAAFLKDWYKSTKPHGVIYQKAVIRVLLSQPGAMVVEFQYRYMVLAKIQCVLFYCVNEHVSSRYIPAVAIKLQCSGGHGKRVFCPYHNFHCSGSSRCIPVSFYSHSKWQI